MGKGGKGHCFSQQIYNSLTLNKVGAGAEENLKLQV